MDVIELVVAVRSGGGLFAVINRWLDRRAQKIREEMRTLHEVRTPLYRELIRPWATALAAARAGQDPAQALAGSADSPEYNRALFEFAITASDDLIRSFSKMMFAASLRHALPKAGRNNIEDPQTLLADFIFQLRRALGLRKTNLERDELIRVLLPHSGNADISEILCEAPKGSHSAGSAASPIIRDVESPGA